MNRFEIIYEKIGSMSQGVSDRISFDNLDSSIARFEVGWRLNRGSMDDSELKRLFVDVFYDLCVVGNMVGECGSCLSGDLEEKVRVVVGNRRVIEDFVMRVPEATVINVDGAVEGDAESDLLVGFSKELKDKLRSRIPDLRHPLKPLVAEGDALEAKIRTERAAGVRNYRIWCEGANFKVNTSDKVVHISQFYLPVCEVHPEWEVQLLEDLLASTGLDWLVFPDPERVVIRTYNKIEEFILTTRLLLQGPKIRLL